MNKQKGFSIIIVVILIIALGTIGFLVYQNIQLKKQAAVPSPTPTSIPVSTPTPGQSLKPGWTMYTNEKYGFEFSYPMTYKVLTDSENLYGWPKAILLLYKGGQSYDMAVEIWNTEAEYKAKSADSSILTVFKTKDGKFITLLNQNKDSEVSQIISTFKFIGANSQKAEECLTKTTCNGTAPCMANPASVFCTCMGGQEKITNNSGGQGGICAINGKEYDEWEYFRSFSPSQ